MSDHPRPAEMHHGFGETVEQHLAHSNTDEVKHWGLSHGQEERIFYIFAVPSWAFEIVAGIMGAYFSSKHPAFIAMVTIFLVFHWAAWLQTVIGMLQRASWVRDESNLPDRRRYLYLAVRLNRLMFPTAVFALVFFLVAYARRKNTKDLADWLLFLLFFIINTVCCVMNAYNNITWESDRLEYEEGSSPYSNTLYAILGYPSKKRKQTDYHEE